MICKKCGKENQETAKFCSGCGSSLKEKEAVVENDKKVSAVVTKEDTNDKVIETVKANNVSVQVNDFIVCPVCGKRNKAESVQCCICGEKLNDILETQTRDDDNKEEMPLSEDDDNELPQKKEDDSSYNNKSVVVGDKTVAQGDIKKNFDFKNKNVLIAVGTVITTALIGIGAFFCLDCGPGDTVAEYLQAISEGKYEVAYDYLDVKDKKFLTKDAYLNSIVDLKNNKVIISNNPYILINKKVSDVDCKISISGNDKKYHCMTKVVFADGAKLELPIVLKDVGGFFSDYKIDCSNICGKATFALPIGSNTNFDGVVLKGVNVTENVETYEVSDVFMGTHKLNVQHPLYKEYKGTLLVNAKDDNENMDIVKYMQLKSNVNEIVENNIRTFVDELLVSAVQKKSMDKTNKDNKIDDSIINMLGKITDYCHKDTNNPISTMKIEKGSIVNIDWMDNSKANLKYTYSGKYTRKNNSKGTNDFNGVINVEVVPNGEKVIVQKVIAYNLRIKK